MSTDVRAQFNAMRNGYESAVHFTMADVCQQYFKLKVVFEIPEIAWLEAQLAGHAHGLGLSALLTAQHTTQAYFEA